MEFQNMTRNEREEMIRLQYEKIEALQFVQDQLKLPKHQERMKLEYQKKVVLEHKMELERRKIGKLLWHHHRMLQLNNNRMIRLNWMTRFERIMMIEMEEMYQQMIEVARQRMIRMRREYQHLKQLEQQRMAKAKIESQKMDQAIEKLLWLIMGPEFCSMSQQRLREIQLERMKHTNPEP